MVHSQFEFKFIGEHDVSKAISETETDICGHDGIY